MGQTLEALRSLLSHNSMACLSQVSTLAREGRGLISRLWKHSMALKTQALGRVRWEEELQRKQIHICSRAALCPRMMDGTEGGARKQIIVSLPHRQVFSGADRGEEMPPIRKYFTIGARHRKSVPSLSIVK